MSVACVDTCFALGSVACVPVAAEVKELEEKGELEDGDPLNNFFKKIFSQVLGLRGPLTHQNHFDCHLAF